MKKYIIAAMVVLSSVMLYSCGASRVADLRSLSLGMSKVEVVSVVGKADRILGVSNTEGGLQEILEFRTYYNEVYAVEFINDSMVGYEFLYEDNTTIVTGTIVPMYPIGPYRPIYHVQPNRPTHPNRPTNPNRPNRPTQPSRPNGSVGTTRPVEKVTPEVSPRPTNSVAPTREVRK